MIERPATVRNENATPSSSPPAQASPPEASCPDRPGDRWEPNVPLKVFLENGGNPNAVVVEKNRPTRENQQTIVSYLAEQGDFPSLIFLFNRRKIIPKNKLHEEPLRVGAADPSSSRTAFHDVAANHHKHSRDQVLEMLQLMVKTMRDEGTLINNRLKAKGFSDPDFTVEGSIESALRLQDKRGKTALSETVAPLDTRSFDFLIAQGANFPRDIKAWQIAKFIYNFHSTSQTGDHKIAATVNRMINVLDGKASKAEEEAQPSTALFLQT